MKLISYGISDAKLNNWKFVGYTFEELKKFWLSNRECDFCKKELKSVSDTQYLANSEGNSDENTIYIHSECIPKWEELEFQEKYNLKITK